MTASKKARGRAKKDERSLAKERRAHAEHNDALGRTAPTILPDDKRTAIFWEFWKKLRKLEKKYFSM